LAGGPHPWVKPGKLNSRKGAINVIFADGHAQLVKLPQLWTFYWHRNWIPAQVIGP
jgi:prepilin-type processing-associated H-X9-DG protein